MYPSLLQVRLALFTLFMPPFSEQQTSIPKFDPQHSPGGVVTAGLAVYDTMQYIRPDICTIGMGQAASMGSLLLTAGAPGMRFVLPNTKVISAAGRNAKQ